jgi:RNA polymerase sigma factor (sigma-70 family)
MQTPTAPPDTRTTLPDTLLSQIAALARDFSIFLSIAAGYDDEVIAEDIAHDVVLDCVLRIRAGEWAVPSRSLAAYVRNAVRRRMLDCLRRDYHRLEREEDYVREVCAGTQAWMAPDLANQDRELSEFLARTLASLPEVCRKTYLMIRDGNASYDEVAARLGVTRSAVSANIVRAQRVFRERLLERDIVPRRAAKGGVKGTRDRARGEESNVR